MDKKHAIAQAITGLDSRYIEEAATFKAPPKRLYLRPLVSLAACGLLVAGLALVRPQPLKVRINGQNVLGGTVTYQPEPAPMTFRAVETLDIPVTVDPGKNGTLTVTAGENTSLVLHGEERTCLTLEEKTEFLWCILPDRADCFSLEVTQGEKQYLLLAQPEDSGDVKLSTTERKNNDEKTYFYDFDRSAVLWYSRRVRRQYRPHHPL